MVELLGLGEDEEPAQLVEVVGDGLFAGLRGSQIRAPRCLGIGKQGCRAVFLERKLMAD
ncbi:hypothetical protein ACFXBB_07960 [Streptomyces scopuliridis]|uniref:hypothetical protein n=1 Tax=Streptomyces scopuliridis TaxID=452529 RepID=UPI0036B61EBE